MNTQNVLVASATILGIYILFAVLFGGQDYESPTNKAK